LPLKDSNQPRTGLISEVYLSARQLIALELVLVLELGATTSHIQASTETLTHRKPILYLLFKSQISQRSRTSSSSRTSTIFKIWRRQSAGNENKIPVIILITDSNQGPPGHQFLEVGDIVFPVGEQVVSDSV
jgi:hypothetical protein